MNKIAGGVAAAGIALAGALAVFVGTRESAANSMLVGGCDDPAVSGECWIIRGSFGNSADALQAVVDAESGGDPLPLPGVIDTTELDCDLFAAGPEGAELPLFCTAALRDASGTTTHVVFVSHQYVAEQFDDLAHGQDIDGFYLEIREVAAGS